MSHLDVFAWVLAERGALRAAAHLVGGAQQYERTQETGRDEVRQQASAGALAHLAMHASADQLETWIADGALLSEDALAAAVRDALDTTKKQP